MVPVYGRCSCCRHCRGAIAGKRVAPSPRKDVLDKIRQGKGSDENLMNAARMFNLLVRGGHAISCDDDANTGYPALS